VPRFVEDIGELLDFSAREAFEASHDAAADANRIGYIAKNKLDGGKSSIDLAKQLLAIRTAREQRLGGLLAIVVHTVSDRQKLHIATLPHEFGVHPGDARGAMVLRFPHQALNRSLSAFVDNRCHLLDLAAGEGFYARSDTTRKPDGMD
jgi:hypothetical protein